MNYLGIHVGHNASACLMINGKIVLALHEERFNKIKNFTGYPKKSIDYCKKYLKKKKLKIDKAAFSTIKHPPIEFKYPLGNFMSVSDWHNYFENYYKPQNNLITKIFNKNKNLKKLIYPYDKVKNNQLHDTSVYRKISKDFLSKQIGLNKKYIYFLDHHLCHSYYAYFSAETRHKKACVVTIDSWGDDCNQSLWIPTNNGDLKRITSSDQCDLARIYRFITLILGMKPNEHEFKVMGLSAYSNQKYFYPIYKNIFKKILKFQGLKLVHNNRPKDLYNHLKKGVANHRFDNIAGAVQFYIEETVSQLLSKIYKKYNIKNFYFSGGLAMNVKMYNYLLKKNFVKFLHCPPSSSDESLCIGACYFLSKKEKSSPISNINLGRKLMSDDTEINLNVIKKLLRKKNLIINKNVTVKNVAKLLNNGEIIAVARGREEFGARALGNRSIICNPNNLDQVRRINKKIKSRDFWMPFALTILKEDHKKYIKNNKNVESNYMTIAFETKKKYFNKIKAGCHNYDQTVRPQILSKKHNVNYYKLLREFKKISKIPALLNTSLNLHGDPKASDINSVIHTFLNSDLDYLYLEDKYLIKKKNV